MVHKNTPWNAEEVAALNAYQRTRGVHPFTGTRGEDGTETALIATAAGWVEHEGGPIVQTWAHDWMTTWRHGIVSAP